MNVTGTLRRRGLVVRRPVSPLWAAQLALSGFFLFAAVPKLVGSHSEVHLFAEIGAGQGFRYLVVAVEPAGAVGLFVPPLATLAAAGLALDMAGASIVNIAVLHSPVAALTLPLCAALPRSRADAFGRT
jgi:putative oxidoreductase